ncbi:MAG: acyl-CoA thioesterase [Deltaproteobacteria bacterium]|nr:acyl-CoA thioesterase [Deltaproteobacteria bacterium]
MSRLRETSVELEVPFSDVDMLGVVWHGHYFKYVEAARTKLFRSCGLDAGDLIGSKYLLFVIESKCRHAFPLFYADRMRVDAWVKDIKHRISIHYEITNLNHSRRAARAHTILATADLQRNLLLETPHEIQSRLLE